MRPRIEVDGAGTGLPLSVEAIPWRIGPQRRITIVAKATLSLAGSGRGGPLPAEALRPGTAELAPALPHAQITVSGHAYGPPGAPRGMMNARVAIVRGPTVLLDKSILVYGDRQTPADLPRPFQVMPLVPERAPASGWNPVGRAIAKGDPPPNLVPSSPSHPVACFGPVPSHWPSRMGLFTPAAMAGAEAADFGLFDFRYFQDAPFDQWLTSPLQGDETIVLEGLSPHLPRLSTDLPGLHARATWRHTSGAGGSVRMRVDCVAVDADRGVLSYACRGHFGLPAGILARDLVVRISLADTPPSLADIAAASQGSADLEATSAMAPLRLGDAQLAAGTTGRLPALTAEDIERARNPMPFAAAARSSGPSARGARSIEELRQGTSSMSEASAATTAVAAGKPGAHLGKTAPPAPTAQAAAAPAAVVAAPAPPAAVAVPPPPAASASRSSALDAVARLLDGSLTGDEVRAADLAGASLDGADLSGRDLRGARLRGAKLSGARLRGAKLEDADLEEATLAGADLESASLDRARLAGADLTGANLERTTLRRASLRGARLENAKLRHAVLDEVDASGARFDGADLARCRAERGRFDGARFDGARLDDVEWPHAVLDGASFKGAFLVRAVVTHGSFARADLSGADLREASLRAASLRDALCDGTVFDRADLRGANLVGAILAPDALVRARAAGAKRG